MIKPGMQFTQVAGKTAVFLNLRGGVSFNDKWNVGGFYGHLLADNQREGNLPLVDSYYAGGFIEYSLWSSSLVHLSFPLALGVIEIDITR